MSAGTAYSPSRQGTVTRRPISGITGRERMLSTIVASIVASAASPERAASRRRSWAFGAANEPLPGPGQGVRSGLVPGEDEGEQLVAELPVAQCLALLGPCLQQQREDVAAFAEVGRPPRWAITA